MKTPEQARDECGYADHFTWEECRIVRDTMKPMGKWFTWGELTASINRELIPRLVVAGVISADGPIDPSSRYKRIR
jgi:hypothetical protein